jgi:hypothetical protein
VRSLSVSSQSDDGDDNVGGDGWMFDNRPQRVADLPYNFAPAVPKLPRDRDTMQIMHKPRPRSFHLADHHP